jgi:thioesterase domain-containing protein
MAAGLRSHALKEALERRQEARAARRRREEERRRQELERNMAHLQKGMERWQWRQTAKEFLRMVRTEARRRSLDKDAVDEWLAWADGYIDQRGLEVFFDKWRLSDAGASPDAKSRR